MRVPNETAYRNKVWGTTPTPHPDAKTVRKEDREGGERDAIKLLLGGRTRIKVHRKSDSFASTSGAVGMKKKRKPTCEKGRSSPRG